jgi:hypothetical protein
MKIEDGISPSYGDPKSQIREDSESEFEIDISWFYELTRVRPSKPSSLSHSGRGELAWNAEVSVA